MSSRILEKNYDDHVMKILVKIKIADMPEDFDIPRHPEFEFVKSVSDEEWVAKHSSTGEMVMVKKSSVGGHCYFDISPIL